MSKQRRLLKSNQKWNHVQPISFSVEVVTHPLFVGVDDVTVPAYVGDPLTVDWDSVFVGVEVWGAAYDINNNKIYVNDGTGLYEWVVGSGTVTFLGNSRTLVVRQYQWLVLLSIMVHYMVRGMLVTKLYTRLTLSTFVATVFIDYSEDTDFDFGGLAVDPNTGEFYGTSDDTDSLGWDCTALTWTALEH